MAVVAASLGVAGGHTAKPMDERNETGAGASPGAAGTPAAPGAAGAGRPGEPAGQRGVLYWRGYALPAQLRHGQVWIEVPFKVDREQLDSLLRRQLYAVGWDHDRLDSVGWGYEYDPEGYYPYWVFPVPGDPGRAVLAFAPQDYLELAPEGTPARTASYQTSGPDAENPAFHPLEPPSDEVQFEIGENLTPGLPAAPFAAGATGDPRPPAGRVPVIGPAAAREAARWLPFLWEAREDDH